METVRLVSGNKIKDMVIIEKSSMVKSLKEYGNKPTGVPVITNK